MKRTRYASVSMTASVTCCFDQARIYWSMGFYRLTDVVDRISGVDLVREPNAQLSS